jgi:phospholipase/carboxylesterase
MRVTSPRRGRPHALLLALHGAGSGGAPGGLYAFRGAWTVPGLVIVAPAAAGTAWSLGATDVDFVDRVLQRAFARCRVDRRRIAVGGFSSGAAMALWLGLSNGDLFRGVIVLSGGGALPGDESESPPFSLLTGRSTASFPSSSAATQSRASSEGWVTTSPIAAFAAGTASSHRSPVRQSSP